MGIMGVFLISNAGYISSAVAPILEASCPGSSRTPSLMLKGQGLGFRV